MKKLLLIILIVAFASRIYAQTASITVVTPACDSNGVLAAAFTGLTPPLTVIWYEGSITVTHSGVTALSDTLTGFTGANVTVRASDASFGLAYADDTGLSPFKYTVATTNAVCPSASSGSATAAVTGGTPPYSYQWYNSSTMTTVGTSNPVSLPAGVYGLMITDNAGCVYGSEYVKSASVMTN